ncbi:MAG: Rrf2 family transcriptional regulator [Clostridia bacterium]|nr:Rrf2 family transcriptional regulator [Clostridia bacterium]MBQ8973858.1 Rrf2 family transcriptional regulator [Clostridia bacterium]
MDTRFSAAIHALILISASDCPMTSEQIAESVGTNASYIRKLTCLLKKGGVLYSRQGIGGFKLRIPPEELTLYEIYRAISEMDEVRMFDLHQNPNDRCVVGRHIRPALAEEFREIERQAERALKGKTLANCIEKLQAEIGRNGDLNRSMNGTE